MNKLEKSGQSSEKIIQRKKHLSGKEQKTQKDEMWGVKRTKDKRNLPGKKELLERGDYSWTEDSIRMILTPGNVARNIYFYVQEIGYFKTFPPYFSERENLESFLIIYTLSGNGELEYRGERYSLSQGKCFFINCQEHHIYKTEENSEWEFLWVHFNGNNVRGYFEESVKDGFRILDLGDSDVVENNLRRMISLFQAKNLTTEFIVSNLLNGILTEVLLHTVTSQADTFQIPDYIRQIVNQINKNFRETLTLEELADMVHLSKYHVLREFKKYMGVTIHEYLITERISYAKELLKYSSLPVSEIAYETGMNNVTHFINLFKAREGSTPLAYRKAWKEN